MKKLVIAAVAASLMSLAAFAEDAPKAMDWSACKADIATHCATMTADADIKSCLEKVEVSAECKASMMK